MTVIYDDALIAGNDYRQGLPPSHCTQLLQKRTGTTVELVWSDPGNTVLASTGKVLCTWAGTRIVRKVGEFPRTPEDGELIVDNQVLNRYASSPLTIVEPSADVEYFYAAFPYSDHYVFNLSKNNKFGVQEFGFVLNDADSNPDTRLSYDLDTASAGLSKAYMNYTTGKFDYGSHKNAWWLPKPCVLGCGGTASSTDDHVLYYLNPDNYAEKLDGSASNITNTALAGNVMVEIPQIWTKYEIDPANSRIYHIKFANKKLDDDYQAFAFYNKDGDLCPYIYRGAYDASYISNRSRCISGQATGNTQTAQNEVTFAKANGQYWYTDDLSTRLLINNLLMYMSLSSNSQAAFGNGHYTGGQNVSSLLKAGTGDAKGYCWGSNGSGKVVKTLGIENWWGNVWLRTAGYTNSYGVQKIKLCPYTNDGSTATAYNFNGDGYIVLPSQYNIGTNSEAYITSMALIPPYGLFPVGTYSGGSSTTGYCDGIWSNTTQENYSYFGGSCVIGFIAGLSACSLPSATSTAAWPNGSSLTCKPKVS